VRPFGARELWLESAHRGQSAPVPLVDVTYNSVIDAHQLGRLAALLEDVVPRAVDCPEEPLTGPPGVGDLEIRFHPKAELDVGELGIIVEVRTKPFETGSWTPSSGQT
jgi:hypothetical protein